MFRRSEVEQVIAKKKVAEVYSWFEEHFKRSSRADYIKRSPFLIIQGPTGCGKTTTLKCVADDLRLQFREYSETTDVTAIITTESNRNGYDDNDRANLSFTIERRKAARFEQFVVDSIRFNPLYPVTKETLPAEDSEFESDDEFDKPIPMQPQIGVIIHIESPLSFARYSKILIQCTSKLRKVIAQLSRTVKRRVAIVFENLDCESDNLLLPTKLKSSLGIQTIKFNEITKASIKSFARRLLKNRNLDVNEETLKKLCEDCDGDLRACINSVDFLSDGMRPLNGDGGLICPVADSKSWQAIKKQKFDTFTLNGELMRDTTRRDGFFHILGKVFYQKRFYPIKSTFKLPTRPLSVTQIKSQNGTITCNRRPINRPYETEHKPEDLAEKLGTSGSCLLSWLHHHYYKYCATDNMDTAALFLENLSEIDTISMDSTQSSQFYEAHKLIDQWQAAIAVTATIFSLYHDCSDIERSSDAKVNRPHGQCIKRSSVEVIPPQLNGKMVGFNRPISLGLYKIIESHRVALDYVTSALTESNNQVRLDAHTCLTDYLPYLSEITKKNGGRNGGGGQILSKLHNGNCMPPPRSQIAISTMNLVSNLEKLSYGPVVDYEILYERLKELISSHEELMANKGDEFMD